MSRKLILAIETGIGGGSISILQNGSEIDFWKGAAKISRSEDLLANVSALLAKNKIQKNDIKKIAVSRGPGSLTGVRIGIATARGLQKAFGSECMGVSALEAMVLKTKSQDQTAIITAFPIGRDEVCWQSFGFKEDGRIHSEDSPRKTSIEEFTWFSQLTRTSKTSKGCELILTSELIRKIRESKSAFDLQGVSEFDENLAKYIGLRSEQIISENEILPIYARDERFN